MYTQFLHTQRKPTCGIRGEVTRFSEQSRRRLLWEARNFPDLKCILTLTYPHSDHSPGATGGDYMTDGLVVKNHIRKMRQVLTYHNISGFWFLEFQQRGAPHVHFFINGWVPKKTEDKIRSTWFRMVGTQCPHHKKRGLDIQILKKKHAAASYAAKYSTKDEQKTVPDQYRNVGRFWGFFGLKRAKSVDLYTSLTEIYQLARIARNYAKSKARAEGYKIRSPQGWSGYAVYYAAPVLRTWITHHYKDRDIPPETPLKLHTLQAPAFASPALAHTVKTCDQVPGF